MSAAPFLPKLRMILREYPRSRIFLPILISLGIGGSLAESFGLSLIVLLLGLLIGGNVAPVGGALGDLYGVARRFGGDNTSILAALVLSLILAKIIAGMAYGVLSSLLRHSMSEAIRVRLFTTYLHMPYTAFQRRETGELHDALALHSWSISDAFANVARMGANLGSIAVFVTFVIALSPPAAIIAAIGSLLIFLLTASLGRRVAKMGEESLRANASLTERILADLQTMRTVRAFAREPWAARRFRAVSRRARTRFQAIERLQILVYPLTEIAYLSLLAIIAASSSAAGIPNAATFAAVLLLYRMQPSLRELESNRLALAGHSASIDTVLDLLRDRPNVEAQTANRYLGLAQGIVFEDVTFGHGQAAPVLDAASFVIPASGLTIIAGPSGVGKTTVINLLLKLYEPQGGRILVGETPLSDLPRPEWLRHVALAGQDVDLIPGTVAQNIRLGRLNAGNDAVWRAAELAGIAETIRLSSEGMNTIVGERGLKLSGGQRQRVGLARALLRDPDLLILDEATNAIEHQLEASILASIVAARLGRATILITHRRVEIGTDAAVIDLGTAQATKTTSGGHLPLDTAAAS